MDLNRLTAISDRWRVSVASSTRQNNADVNNTTYGFKHNYK